MRRYPDTSIDRSSGMQQCPVASMSSSSLPMLARTLRRDPPVYFPSRFPPHLDLPSKSNIRVAQALRGGSVALEYVWVYSSDQREFVDT